MKPKNSLQIEVAKLSKGLPKLRSAHKKWASLNLFDHYVHRTKSLYTCFECGHSWKVSQTPAMDYLMNETCPKCGLTLKSTERKIRTKREDNRMAIHDVVGRFQVVRFFFVTKHIRLGEKPSVKIDEIVQHWITPEGKAIIKSATFNGLGQWGYTEGWCLGTSLEIRNYGRVDEHTSNKYFVNGNRNTEIDYPDAKYIPELKRNGFKGSTHGFNPAYFFTMILSSPVAETLLKAKQYALLGAFSDDRYRVNKYWASIKIALRHKYIIKKASTWLDYLDDMEELGMDIRNPKYICSPTLEADHQRTTRIIRARREKKDAKEKRIKWLEENRKYKEEKARFFELKFSNGIIDVVVLKDLKDFEKEALAHNHCLFERNYYKKAYRLIMSARKQNERLETIEIDLEKFQIKQCAGFNNLPSPHHSTIMKLVKENMTQIKKLAKQVA